MEEVPENDDFMEEEERMMKLTLMIKNLKRKKMKFGENKNFVSE